MSDNKFWKEKTLDEMSREEWESLCDGCGLCCLIKLEDEDTGEVAYTDVVCALLDIGACQCTDYPNRHVRVPTCIPLTPESIKEIGWLPVTCAYRRLDEGQDLLPWHPLISGDQEEVHRMGVSIRDWAVPESSVAEEDLQDHVRSIVGKPR
ncbi:MAG: YcgN family cysteine cluster protein [Rhizobiales bacterium]|nr:YcgN family cysteine cluster protein [Hyphomicrobiales bacterium]